MFNLIPFKFVLETRLSSGPPLSNPECILQYIYEACHNSSTFWSQKGISCHCSTHETTLEVNDYSNKTSRLYIIDLRAQICWHSIINPPIWFTFSYAVNQILVFVWWEKESFYASLLSCFVHNWIIHIRYLNKQCIWTDWNNLPFTSSLQSTSASPSWLTALQV